MQTSPAFAKSQPLLVFPAYPRGSPADVSITLNVDSHFRSRFTVQGIGISLAGRPRLRKGQYPTQCDFPPERRDSSSAVLITNFMAPVGGTLPRFISARRPARFKLRKPERESDFGNGG